MLVTNILHNTHTPNSVLASNMEDKTNLECCATSHLFTYDMFNQKFPSNRFQVRVSVMNSNIKPPVMLFGCIEFNAHSLS